MHEMPTGISSTIKGNYQMDLSSRIFRLWDVSPTHDRLLLRSPGTNAKGFNIDIVFWAVEHINLVPVLRELSIEVVETPIGYCNTYILRSKEGEFFIKAHGYKISTSDAEKPFESPLDPEWVKKARKE